MAREFCFFASTALFYSNLGDVHRKRDDYERALGAYEQSLEFYRVACLNEDVGIVYLDMGLLHKDAGELDRARLAFEAAADVLGDLGDDRAQIARDELVKLGCGCQAGDCPRDRQGA